MILSEYTLRSEKIKNEYTLAVLSDFHDRESSMHEAIKLTSKLSPDAILVVGDLVDRHRKTADLALEFLRRCARLAPTYFSYGNHEIKYPSLSREALCSTGAFVLDNSYTPFLAPSGELIFIAGQTPYSDFDWLRGFENEIGFKLLLCHNPEYFKKHLKSLDIDLIVSGHAHGGQIRIAGRGIFSPGQGLFPKYTKGLYDNRLLVSTGISNTGGIIPRLGNPTEVVALKLCPINCD